jgi:electron-transferring-flavoprotein dehydrogenase
VEQEAQEAEKARDGFQVGVLTGLVGMGLTGLTKGIVNFKWKTKRPYERVPSLEDYCRERIAPQKVEELRLEAVAKGASLADTIMDEFGWPQIPLDGKLLVSQQDALLIGGKVQAQPGYADHVVVLDPQLCERCSPQNCVENCSGQALSYTEGGGSPQFDREKCVHCGACMWNCTKPLEAGGERCNIDFRAGSGGLHSAEN